MKVLIINFSMMDCTVYITQQTYKFACSHYFHKLSTNHSYICEYPISNVVRVS